MAPHSSTLAWKIPWMEEPGRLQSMGSWRVRHDWATSLALFTFMPWRRKWQPTPVFLPGESQGRGAWWAAVYGVAESQTRLKWLSSSTVLITVLCKGFIIIHGWDLPSVCYLGKVIKKGREHGRICYLIYRYLPAKNFSVQFKRKNQLNIAEKWKLV